MLNQRRCCNCGGAGPFARVATCQDTQGEVLGYVCLCARCEVSLSRARSASACSIISRTGSRRVARCLPYAPGGGARLPGGSRH